MTNLKNDFPKAVALALESGERYERLVENVMDRIIKVNLAVMSGKVSNANVTKACKTINELDAFYFKKTGEHIGRVWNRTDIVDMLEYISEVNEVINKEFDRAIITEERKKLFIA